MVSKKREYQSPVLKNQMWSALVDARNGKRSRNICIHMLMITGKITDEEKHVSHDSQDRFSAKITHKLSYENHELPPLFI